MDIDKRIDLLIERAEVAAKKDKSMFAGMDNSYMNRHTIVAEIHDILNAERERIISGINQPEQVELPQDYKGSDKHALEIRGRMRQRAISIVNKELPIPDIRPLFSLYGNKMVMLKESKYRSEFEIDGRRYIVEEVNGES